MAATPPLPTPPSANSLQNIPTVSAALRHWAQQTPDKAAYIFRAPDTEQRHVVTFGDLYQIGGRLANILHDRGIERGQLVVNALPNSPERAVVDSAILLSGAACVNGVCQLSDASDLKAILRQSQAVALVLDPDFIPGVDEALLQDVTELQEDGRVSSESLPHLKFLLLVGRHTDNSVEDFMSGLRTKLNVGIFYEEVVKEDDVCIVFTTSGSTGLPKLVPCTHGTFMTLLRMRNRPPTAVEFNMGLMGWGSGYFGNITASGATRVLLDARAGLPKDFASFIFKSVTEEGATSGAVPIHLIPALAKKVEISNGGQRIFEVLGLGTQPITKQIVKEASRISHKLVTGYAGTEIFFVSSALLADVNTFEDYFTGRVVQGVEVKVCDDQGHAVKANTRGEILVKSPFVLSGYLNDPQSTAAAFTEDGFFRTGDVGWLDSDGRLFVEGRIKDAITQSRRIVYPGWLESRIKTCPAVDDVVVVGVPDAVLINELCVCVILQSEEWCMEDVKKYVEKEILDFSADGLSMRPRHYLVFDSFPLTATDKIRRMELKRIAEERLTEEMKSSDHT